MVGGGTEYIELVSGSEVCALHMHHVVSTTVGGWVGGTIGRWKVLQG